MPYIDAIACWGPQCVRSCWTAPHGLHDVGKRPLVESLLSSIRTKKFFSFCFIFSCLDSNILVLLLGFSAVTDIHSPAPGLSLPPCLVSAFPWVLVAPPHPHFTWQAAPHASPHFCIASRVLRQDGAAVTWEILVMLQDGYYSMRTSPPSRSAFPTGWLQELETQCTFVNFKLSSRGFFQDAGKLACGK